MSVKKPEPCALRESGLAHYPDGDGKCMYCKTQLSKAEAKRAREQAAAMEELARNLR